MAAVFTLFGELKADTGAFKNSLRDAEARLKATERAIEQTEAKAKKIGMTSATTARSFEKMNEKVAETRAKLQQTSAAFERGEVSSRKLGTTFQSVDRATASLNSRLKDTHARMSDLASGGLQRLQGRLQSVGSGITSFGQSLAVGLTVPLGLFGAASIKAASDFDSLMNKLRAGLGTTQAATARFKELQTLAKQNAGVFVNSAADIDSFFRPMKIGTATINELIKSLGRLQLADAQFESREFGRNLVQIFNSNEIQDIRQAVDRFPRFGELLVEKFGFDGTTADDIKAGMAKLKNDSKLSLEDFLSGFADAVQKDKNLAALGETVSSRFEKMRQEVMTALVPFGDAILKAITPALDAVVPALERLAQMFSSLPQSAQIAAVALGVVGLAAGPVIIAIGAMVSAIGTIAGALSGIAIAPVAIALTALAAVLAVVAAGAAALYVAWQNNFGGIREYTATIVEGVRSAWAGMMDALSELIGEGLTEIYTFWAQNGKDILQAVKEISDAVKTTWQLQLAALSKFWKDHGESITAIATTTWTLIKEVILTALRVITHGVTMAAALINGDWKRFGEVFINLNISITNSLIRVWNSLMDAMTAIGKNIIAGLIAGMQAQAGQLMATAYKLAGEVQNAFRNALQIKSPSRVMAEVGQNIIEGIEVGMLAQLPQLLTAANSVADAVKNVFQEATIDNAFDVFRKPSGEVGEREAPFGGTQTNQHMDVLQPPTQPWTDFWGTMFESLSRFRNELPSMKSLIGENLIDSISQIGDVFADAVTRWDGTAKGFFKSIASGFAAMAREIIAQLIRIAVMQAVLKLVGLISGVAAGGASSAAGAPGGSIGTGSAGPLGGAFSGGSSLLGSLADAGKNLASGFTGAMSGFGAPSMMPAFAGSAGATYNNSRTTNANFNISGGGSGMDTRAQTQIAREVIRLLDKEQRRNK